LPWYGDVKTHWSFLGRDRYCNVILSILVVHAALLQTDEVLKTESWRNNPYITPIKL
jgi:hypothetical protein